MFLYISIILLCLATAKGESGGSNYSIFGLGDWNNSLGAAYEALGGTSIVFPSESSINLRNPAMWAKASTTRLRAGYHFNQHLVSDGNNSLYQNNGKLDGIIGLFSIDTSKGISAVFGVVPRSSVGYYILSPIEITLGEDKVLGRTTYLGKGGISSGFIGISARLFGNLSLGFSVNTTFGSVNSEIRTSFFNEYTYEYHTFTEDYLKGFGFSAGFAFDLSPDLSIGFFFEKNNNLTVNREVLTSSLRQSDTVIKSDFTTQMPSVYGIGAAYSSGNFIIGSDLIFQDFTGFDYKPGSSTQFRNTLQFSIGAERVGNPSPTAQFLDKIGYKFGLGYKQLYYKVSGEGIDEYYGSLGMKVPLPGSAVVDCALVFGTRGTTDRGLIREYFSKLIIDISIGELWFKPFKRTY